MNLVTKNIIPISITIVLHVLIILSFSANAVGGYQKTPGVLLELDFTEPTQMDVENLEATQSQYESDAQSEEKTLEERIEEAHAEAQRRGKTLTESQKADIEQGILDEINSTAPKTKSEKSDWRKELQEKYEKGELKGEEKKDDPDRPLTDDEINAQREAALQNDVEVKKSFELTGRSPQPLLAPSYRCKSGGVIFLEIKVNQQGKIINVDIDETKSSYTDNCLRKESIKYAYRSKFNADLNAPNPQKGSITYVFQKQ